MKSYKEYKIPKETRSAKQLCMPKNFALQPPQMFAAEYLKPGSKAKNLLIYHKIGAGKTCTAIQIAERWKDKPGKILVACPASLIENFKGELRSPCGPYMTDAERRRYKAKRRTPSEKRAIRNEVDPRWEKHYNIISHHKLMDFPLNRASIILIDEAHNMLRSRYPKVLKKLRSVNPKIPIVLLTATPIIDHPVEVARAFNLLRISPMLPDKREDFETQFMKLNNKDIYVANTKKLGEFKKYFTGIVSYYRGAHPKTFPTLKGFMVRCKMRRFQKKCYLSVLQEVGGFRATDWYGATNSFYISSRIVSNIAFPNKESGYEGMESLTTKRIREYLREYSEKFYQIMKRVERAKGPVFIYSSFKSEGGLAPLAMVLEALGYKDFEDTEKPGKKTFAVWSGDHSDAYHRDILEHFNHPSNADGSKIQIILGSPSIQEGVTLLRVRQVHMLEPVWNAARIQQILGRAVRYCSHKDVPPANRVVHAYVYCSVLSGQTSVDEWIFQMAMNKKKVNKPFLKAIWENAVDCELNKEANKVSCKKN